MQGRVAATLAVAVVVSSAGCAIDDDQERAIGQDAAAQIEREVPLVTDATINAYVTSLGTRHEERRS
jgi:predicted Zn-dependent protease